MAAGALVTVLGGLIVGCSALVQWKDPPNQCGDGVRDPWESCDGTDLGDQSCEGQGFSGGTLSCNNDCEFVLDQCHDGTCGNGVWEPNGAEECDYPEMGQGSCESLGYQSGQLQCNLNCTYDTSGCTNAVCGDGYCDLQGGEDNGSCPEDCTANCGDGVCEVGRGETTVGCESDCAWQTVSAGSQFTCATRKDANVWCWGSNEFGKLGDNTDVDSSWPVRAANLGDVGQVSAGREHVCAIGTGASVSCWGQGGLGQLGYGNVADRSQPEQISSFGSADRIAAGGDSTCVLQLGGQFFCWGSNDVGQLGIGNANPGDNCGGNPCSDEPVHVTVLDAGQNISVSMADPGSSHACGLQNGNAWCWGESGLYQTGHAPSVDDATPFQVAGVGNLVWITAGQGFTCASQNAAVFCWGDNYYGQLGNGSGIVDATWIPQPVVGFGENVTSLSAGYAHVCASGASGSAWCWGLNDTGQLGDGTFHARNSATVVGALPGQVLQISAGATHTCAVVSLPGDIRELYCWGGNDRGQLGDGTNVQSSAPVQVIDRPPPSGQ